jgi:hypothetical protein
MFACAREALALVRRHHFTHATEVLMANGLNVSGSYFESCNCFAPCSCVCLSPPSHGDCAFLVAWHIDKGSLGDVQLDGLNAVLFGYSPGAMLESKWRVALYLDERANQPQQEALGKVFSGAAGGPLEQLGPFIGEVMGIKPAQITYRSEGRKRSLSIAGVAEMEIEGLAGQDGGEVTLNNHPLTPVPGFPTVVAKSKTFRYADHGFDRVTSDRNGFYSPFEYRA